MLHPIVHDNPSHLWCGPAVIALVTGQPTSVIHRLAHEWRAERPWLRKAVTGMSDEELKFIVGRLGYRSAYPHCLGTGGTVIRCIDLKPSVPVIASTDEHWFVIWNGYADNTYQTPSRLVPDAVALSVVVHWFGWQQVCSPVFAAPKLPPPARTRPMRRATVLASQFGIRIEKEWENTWFVHCPDEVDDVDDIFDFEPRVHSPEEVLERVEAYIRLVEHVRANDGVLA